MFHPSVIGVLLIYSQPCVSVLSGQGYYNSVPQSYQQNAYSNLPSYSNIQGKVSVIFA